jgi:hypothetical protein
MPTPIIKPAPIAPTPIIKPIVPGGCVINAGKIAPMIASKYELDNNTFILAANDDPVNLISAEVGDSKQELFFPQMKFCRWDNEVNFSARLVHDEAAPQVITKGNQIQWIGERVSANFYDLDITDEDEGGYEFEVVLNEEPDSNVIQFTIQTKGLDFFYQPELSQEEIDEGASRPDNVVGSYAVYCSALKTNIEGGNLYKCGKVGHIYRPWVVDAEGNGVWGELNIDVEAGILSVTIDQDFLDKAVYPVRHAAGLTFGYTTAGGTVGSNPYNSANVFDVHTAGVGETITKYSMYGFFNPSITWQFDAYTVVSGGAVSRLGTATTITMTTTPGWFDSAAVSQALTNGAVYCVAFGNNVNSGNIYYDSATNARDRDITNTTLPTTWAHNSYSTPRYSIYATYTAEGGARWSRLLANEVNRLVVGEA